MLGMGYCHKCDRFKSDKIYGTNYCEECLNKIKGVQNG